MRLVIATHNAAKAREMTTILQRALPFVELLTLADFPGSPEPDETGDTYAENATIKARSACDATGLPALADDAGLEIEALDGAPGLRSRRFGGEDLPFPAKMERILGLLRGVPEARWSAAFRCCVALAWPSGEVETFEATCEGRIAEAPFGEGGFGYDPIFFLPALGRTMAQLSPDEKHAVSHRGKVLAMVAERLRHARAGA